MPDFAAARLEQWMRDHYFSAEFDIGSSGVETFSLRELRELVGFPLEDLDQLVFRDSLTLGGDGLRHAIAGRFAGGQVERVMVTHGSTEANYLLHLALLRPGDRVVVLHPVYQQLASLAEGLGAVCHPWRLRAELGFAPQLEDLASVLDATTRLVIVNFPHNPTGATLSREQFSEFLAMVRSAGAWLLWDGAFAELVYDRPPLPDPTSLYDQAISLGTLSKAYGLPGLRVGWLIAPPDVLEKCVGLRDYISLHLSPLVEWLAEQVISQGDRVLENRLARARANRAVCSRWAVEHGDYIDWFEPQGGVTAFPRLQQVPNVDAFCRQLAESHRILTVPGSCFGFPQHIRLGFGGRRAELENGLRSLATALAAANPKKL
jgi:capreomycidine synthase